MFPDTGLIGLWLKSWHGRLPLQVNKLKYGPWNIAFWALGHRFFVSASLTSHTAYCLNQSAGTYAWLPTG
jgi:hypothetical protein